MDDQTTSLAELMTEAAALVERPAADTISLRLMRDELASALTDCTDGVLANDVCDLLVTLDRVLSRGPGGHRPDGRMLPLAC